jgi:DinB superfamily
MKIDLAAVLSGQITYADMIKDIRHADLCTTTNEIFNEIESILSGATDTTILFVPHDPSASDQSEQGWSVNHIVAHMTASLEEPAAAAAMLARGVQVDQRLRYETPWQDLSTLQAVQARLQESQRICNAFLNAWPDQPHLDVTRILIPSFGPMNAIGLYILGIVHAQSHLDQLRETVRQSTLAKNL